jgi:hypothetical protein
MKITSLNIINTIKTKIRTRSNANMASLIGFRYLNTVFRLFETRSDHHKLV